MEAGWRESSTESLLTGNLAAGSREECGRMVSAQAPGYNLKDNQNYLIALSINRIS